MRGSSVSLRPVAWPSRVRASTEGAEFAPPSHPSPPPPHPREPGARSGPRGPSVAPRALRGAATFRAAASAAATAAMAPLLGRKPFPLVKPLPGEEPLFTIAHTQEAFRTREYPFQPGRPAARGVGRGGPGARRGRAGRAARACGSCQRAGRRRACIPSRSSSPPFRGVGARAGPEPRAHHPFPGSALCPRASLSRSGPLPPGGFRPEVRTGEGFPFAAFSFFLN